MSDRLAKQAARRHKPPQCQIDMVRSEGQLLMDAAMWIGKATALANHFPNPNWNDQLDIKLKFLRDSQAGRPWGRMTAAKKRKSPDAASVPRIPGDLSGCARWEALRLRICAKARKTSLDTG